MTVVENVAFMQRMLNSAIEDLAAEEVGSAGLKVRGKLEILAGEMAIFRSYFEEPAEAPAMEGEAEADEAVEVLSADDVEVIEA